MADVKKEFIVYVSYLIKKPDKRVDEDVHIRITCDESDNPQDCDELQDVMAQRSSFTLEDVLRDEITNKNDEIRSVDDIYIEKISCV